MVMMGKEVTNTSLLCSLNNPTIFVFWGNVYGDDGDLLLQELEAWESEIEELKLRDWEIEGLRDFGGIEGSQAEEEGQFFIVHFEPIFNCNSDSTTHAIHHVIFSVIIIFTCKYLSSWTSSCHKSHRYSVLCIMCVCQVFSYLHSVYTETSNRGSRLSGV